MKPDVKQMVIDSLPFLVSCAGQNALCHAYGCRYYIEGEYNVMMGKCAYGCKPPGKHLCP